jgi:hypothetical protein
MCQSRARPEDVEEKSVAKSRWKFECSTSPRMPISKKRKLAAGEAPTDSTAMENQKESEELEEVAEVEEGSVSRAKELRERFKALQARAVSHTQSSQAKADFSENLIRKEHERGSSRVTATGYRS